MHIFVPALPAAAVDLHATPAALELTISLYILGLAVGQLVYGPASDRFGRRPALLVGLSIFTIASVAGLFAPDVAHARPRALFSGSRRMFGAGARARHHPRHVAAARSRAAPRAHEFAGDRGPRGRAADRRRAQRPLGLASDPDGTERPGRRQFRARVAHSAGDAAGGALRQRLAIRAGLCRPAALPAVSGLRHRRRLRDDLALCVHRLRAFHFCRSAASPRAPASGCILRSWSPASGSAVFSQAS